MVGRPAALDCLCGLDLVGDGVFLSPVGTPSSLNNDGGIVLDLPNTSGGDNVKQFPTRKLLPEFGFHLLLNLK